MTRVVSVLMLLVAALAAPLFAEAQQARRPTIGVTLVHPPPSPYGEALRRCLAELGWIDGQNVRIEYRYAEGRPERYPGFFAELLRSNVDVIVAGGGTPAARAAKQVTSTTPIVMFATDPVTAGLVASLARPGGNMTGFASLNPEMSAKRLGLLKEALPQVERIAVLCDPADIGEAGATEASARSFGGRGQVLAVSRVEDFDEAFAAAKQARAEALIVCASPFFKWTGELSSLAPSASSPRPSPPSRSPRSCRGSDTCGCLLPNHASSKRFVTA
jgi:putative ABC transport system substrate-binding protein